MAVIRQTLETSCVRELKSLIGKTLCCVRFMTSEIPDTVRDYVVLDAGDTRIDLVCGTNEIDYFGQYEDMTFLHAQKSKRPVPPKEMAIDRTVTGITEVRDTILQYSSGKISAGYEFTRGIIIELGDTRLSFEKIHEYKPLMSMKTGDDVIYTYGNIDDYRYDFFASHEIDTKRETIQI